MPRLSCTNLPAVPWRSHLCSFYQSDAEFQRLVISYIQAGLDDHEGCLWILPRSLASYTATTALQRAIPQVHDYLRTGQLELIPCTEWYGLHTTWDTNRILADCSRKVAQVASRFAGLRVTGDWSWVQSADQRAQFVVYERAIHKAAETANVLALCTYSVADLTASDMLGVLESHGSILLADRLEWRKVDMCGI